MTVAHFEICDVSLFTTGSRNAGRVGYSLALDSRIDRCDWKVGADILDWWGLGGRRIFERQGTNVSE